MQFDSEIELGKVLQDEDDERRGESVLLLRAQLREREGELRRLSGYLRFALGN